MVIEINDTTTIRQIQEAFSRRYPYLEINFFTHAPNEDNLYEKKDLVPVDKPLRSVKRTHISALLEITPDNTIAGVEKEFLQRFGLRAQVLRKCDTHWILPIDTDQLTLQQQNDIGQKEAAHIVHPDYDTRIEDII